MLQRDAVLVTLLFSGICLFSAVYYFLQYREKERLARVFGVTLFSVFCLFFIYLAVLRRSPSEVQTELMPLWSYRATISGSYGIDVFAQIIENIVIFVPIGFFLPFALGEKKSGFLSAFVFGFVLSFLAEGCQLVFRLGVCETDDLINNTVGTLVGFGLWYAMTARTAKRGRKPCVMTENPKRLVQGVFPLFLVYEVLVFTLALRKINV